MNPQSPALSAASNEPKSAAKRTEWGFVWGLLAAILLGAASALSSAEPGAKGLLPLSILAAASFMMPLCWALQVLTLSRNVLLWLVSTFLNSAWMLTLFGAWLSQRTHHRPLGGATFAVLGSLMILSSAVLSGRAVSLKGSGDGKARWLGNGLFLMLLITGGLGTLLVVGRAVQADASAIRHVVEVLGVVVAASFCARASGPKKLSLPRSVGPWAWVVVGVCTAYAAVQYPEAAQQVSPVLSGFVPLFR
ncbi:MAG: hypothetical protein SFV15_06045 [Polyangiaceae bacterium]|nr:hypothetical protein [Polyangiaceae bacterium]